MFVWFPIICFRRLRPIFWHNERREEKKTNRSCGLSHMTRVRTLCHCKQQQQKKNIVRIHKTNWIFVVSVSSLSLFLQPLLFNLSSPDVSSLLLLFFYLIAMQFNVSARLEDVQIIRMFFSVYFDFWQERRFKKAQNDADSFWKLLCCLSQFEKTFWRLAWSDLFTLHFLNHNVNNIFIKKHDSLRLVNYLKTVLAEWNALIWVVWLKLEARKTSRMFFKRILLKDEIFVTFKNFFILTEKKSLTKLNILVILQFYNLNSILWNYFFFTFLECEYFREDQS